MKLPYTYYLFYGKKAGKSWKAGTGANFSKKLEVLPLTHWEGLRKFCLSGPRETTYPMSGKDLRKTYSFFCR